MNHVFIPRTVDKPPIVLLWSMEEVMLIGFCVGLGMMIEQALLFFIASLMFVKKYREFETMHPDGFLIHFLYWQGLPVVGDHKTFPKSYIEEWVQ